MKLDVGCGNFPRGDINTDLFTGKTPHGKNRFINPKSIRNFVKADIHYLPFKENIFSETSCFHVLEHKGVYFLKAVDEMIRVTNGIVKIEIPHRFADKGKKNMHNKLFNQTSIQKLLRKKAISFDLEKIYAFYPHEFLPLIRFPKLLRIEIASGKISENP